MLQEIVQGFNDGLKYWQEKFGHEANFAWRYKDGKHLTIQAVAGIEVTGVDRIIYRRDGVSSAAVQKIIEDAKVEAVKNTGYNTES